MAINYCCISALSRFLCNETMLFLAALNDILVFAGLNENWLTHQLNYKLWPQ